jgi:sec-independent protein translocase protein TatA
MIGSGELIVILCVILVLFGGKKLPEFAKSLGKGIREFKKACNGIEEELDEVVVEEKKQITSQEEKNFPSE